MVQNSESTGLHLVLAQIILAVLVPLAVRYGIVMTTEFPQDNGTHLLAIESGQEEFKQSQNSNQSFQIRFFAVTGFAAVTTGLLLNIVGLIAAGIFLFISALLLPTRLLGLIDFLYSAGLIIAFLISALIFFIKSSHKPQLMISFFTGLLFYSFTWSGILSTFSGAFRLITVILLLAALLYNLKISGLKDSLRAIGFGILFALVLFFYRFLHFFEGQEFLPFKFVGVFVLVVGLSWYVLVHQQKSVHAVS